MNKKKLLALPVPELPKRINKPYSVISTQHGDILQIVIRDEDGLCIRAFCDGKNTILYQAPRTCHGMGIQGGWADVQICSLLGDCMWHRDAKEIGGEIARAFFSKNGYKWFGSYDTADRIYDGFRSRKNENRREQAQAKEVQRRKRHFDLFPECPADLDAFADGKMKQYLFFSKVNKQQKRKVVCSACHKRFLVPKNVPKHKEETVCPKCGNRATWFADFRGNPKAETAAVWTTARKDGDLFWRVTVITRKFSGQKKEFLRSDVRRMLDTEENGKQRTYNYRLVYVPYCGYSWKRYPFGDYGGERGWIYAPSVEEALGSTFFGISTSAMAQITHPADLYRIVQNLRNIPKAEYFAKSGLWRCLETVDRTGAPEIPGSIRHLAKRFDLSFSSISMLSYIGQMPEQWLGEILKIRGGGLSNTVKEIGARKYITNFGRWKEQNPKTDIEQIEQWYADYIGMCEQLGVDLSKKQIRYPKNLKEEHDRLAIRAAEAREQNANKDFAAAVRPLYENMSGYTSKEFTVVFPQLRTDLIAEGQSLNHCVGIGSYYLDHMKGKMMIFFIRAAAEPEKPLYTLQANVEKQTIIQLYGDHDTAAPKKARDFCNAFLKNLYKKTKIQLTERRA